MAVKALSPNHWTTREFLGTIFFFFNSKKSLELLPYVKSTSQMRHPISVITLTTKARVVKAMVFPLVMYGCGSWTIMKAEFQRIDAFELWCWKRLLRVPWVARRSNQSILKEINPEYSLEGPMLKLQYFSHLMRRADY